MIEIQNISKSYGKKQILKDISFTATAGEQIALIGRNGCGKSTLIKILAGIIKADGGSVTCFDRQMKRAKDFSSMFGYIPQTNPLIEELSVQDNISMWTGSLKKPEPWLLEMLGIADLLKTKVSKLSGGMKRRVAIGCAIARKPKILLMDEPTSALDIYYKQSIRTLMKSYTDMQGIIILATHDQEEMRMSNKCYLIENGGMELITDPTAEKIHRPFIH